MSTFPHPLRVVMVDVRNPLNIGAAARAMSNFGFAELRLVNPYEVAFREARSAVKAQGILENAREYKTVAEAIRGKTIKGTIFGDMTFEANGQAKHKTTLFKVVDGKTAKLEVLK